MNSTVSGIILAGGQGTRMNRANKGLELLKGAELIAHVIQRIAPQVDDIVISANEDTELYEAFGLPVVSDSGDSAGPLSGIMSAAQYCKADTIFITACDTPFLPDNIVSILQKGFNGRATMAVANDKTEPLVSLVSRSVVSDIETLLAEGKRSVMHWLERNGAEGTRVEPDASNAFFNVNTYSDLQSQDITN